LVKGFAWPERSGKAATAGGTELAAEAHSVVCCAVPFDCNANIAAADDVHKKFRRENIPHPTQATDIDSLALGEVA
jgi:hypothetical protein